MLSSSFNDGRDSSTFLSDPTDAVIVNTTLIIINKVAVIAVSLESKLADPRADIIPPNVPPPNPKPSLSDPCNKTNITSAIARTNWIMINVVIFFLIFISA